MIGSKFNRLTVIEGVRKIKSRDTVMCECECGKKKRVILWYLTKGKVKCCGCLQQEYASSHPTTKK
jgi:hypothetical protein